MQNRVMRGWIGLILLSMAVWAIACAVNPVSGKREFMLLSESQEIQLGNQSDPSIVGMYGLYQDAKLQQFIETKGKAMAKISHRPNLNYQFRLLDSPVINAFAVPGGYVYFTRGIMAHLNNEAEFAGVLGHEIGHITARHSAKQYSKSQLASVGLGLGAIFSENVARFAGLAQTGIGLLFLKYGRDAERESDRLGVEYSTRIGYDAREMANFFGTLDRMTAPEEGGAGRPPSWMSTHPNPADRVVSVTNLANEWRGKVSNSNLKVNRDPFLQMLEGLVYGEDPQQGYVDGNVFYHPGLKFQFPLPSGWQFANTPSQVQMANKDGSAAIVFTLGEGASPIDAGNKFIQQSQAKVVERNTIKVNGLDAQRMVSDVTTEQGVLGVLSYFIKYGQNIFVFHGYSAKAQLSGLSGIFEGTMRGFKSLSDPARINVKPDRIRIKKVPRTGTLQSALTALKIPAAKHKEHSFINGMQLNDNVRANSLIKTIGK